MKQIKRFFAAVLMMCAMATFFALPAMADNFNNESTAKLTITNVQPGDKFQVWMLVTITQETGSNNLTYAFTPAASAYFTSKNVTLEQFMSETYTNNPTALAELLAELPRTIKNGGLWVTPWGANASSDGIITAEDDGTITITPCKAGGYFLLPISSTEVYNPIFVALTPTVVEGTNTYEFQNKTFSVAAKHAPVSVTKAVSMNTTNKNFGDHVIAATSTSDSSKANNQVVYQITAKLPTYLPNAPYPVVKIEDTLPNGIVFDQTAGVQVYAGNSQSSMDTLLTNGTDYVMDASGFVGNNLTVDFSSKYTQVMGYNYVRVVYTATVTNAVSHAADAGAALTANTNTANYSYSLYPYVNDAAHVVKTATATANVYTNGLSIYKYALGEDMSQKLASAQFDLYRDKNGSDDSSLITTLNVNGVDHDVVKINATIKTNADGKSVVHGLKDGVYYLVETVAPSGYKLDTTPVRVEVGDNVTSGYAQVSIGNSKANLALPTTGSTGMVIFTIIGIAVMGAAVVILILASKKKAR